MKFYVTMIRGARIGYLAGPFATKELAEAQVPAAREEAEKVDPRSVFDAFGVTGVELAKHMTYYRPGVLNGQLGLRTGLERA
jgi:hypothetical protein